MCSAENVTSTKIDPWITPSTSNLMNKLKTQKKVLRRPTAYRRSNVSKLEIVVLENCEIDRLNYQEEFLSSRNTEKIFMFLNYLNKTNCYPKVMYKGDEISRSENETARSFNEFFLALLSKSITDQDITKSSGPNKCPLVLYETNSC